MGCDIHVYPEYRPKSADARWESFGENINPGRHYPAFGHLAGVRCAGPPVAAQRGIPVDAGWGAREGNLFYPQEGAPVPHPDWHSPSWLTPDEWEEAIRRADGEWPGEMVEYDAISALLRFFESKGYEARVVFWFDN